MKKYILILVFASAALVSCVNEPHGNFDYAIFNHERQLWHEQGIENYIFRLNEESMANRHYADMYIQDGVLTYIQLSYNDVPMPVEEVIFPSFLYGNTISDVYAKIETVADSADWCDTVEIQYDSEWHYPKYFRYRRASGVRSIININKFSFALPTE